MKNKARKEFGEPTRASVMKELAKPRMTKSAREGEMNLIAVRTVPGKLTKKKLPPLLFAGPRVAL
jgi:hypothetical protein